MTDEHSHEPDADTDGSEPEPDPWETWEKGGVEYITVRRSGAIAPNSTVYDRYLSDSEAVQIRIKKGTKIIALRPVDEYNENDPTHYRHGSATSNGQVNAKKFLSYQDLEHDESRRYTPEWNDEHGMLVLDLSKSGDVVTKEFSSEDEQAEMDEPASNASSGSATESASSDDD